MSQRNRHKKNIAEDNQTKPLDTNDPELAKMFADRQEIHLTFLESWVKSFPELFGVNLLQAFNYETVQVLNNLFLEDVK